MAIIDKNNKIGEDFRDSLKRLFSNQIVLTKKNQSSGKIILKSTNDIDSEKLSSFKSDLYSPLNDANNGGYYNTYNNTLDTQTQYLIANKNILYSIYNAMDKDPIISSILDIYADETSFKGLDGNIINIFSDDAVIKEILDVLYGDIINVNKNIWTWIRAMVKYGDFLNYMYIKKDYGIIGLEQISPFNFTIELNNTITNKFSGSDENKYVYKLDGNESKVYYKYEIFHLSNNTDPEFYPYGKSILEGARKHWEVLSLLEDAMLIHRIMRAPERRIYKVDVGNLSPAAAKLKLKQVMTDVKKAYVYDTQTGSYNLKYNMHNILEDFFVTKRGDKYSTEIETLPGLTTAPIEDINFILKRLIAAFKVPKAAFGYDENLASKATYSQEDIRFSRTIENIQSRIKEELIRIGQIHLYALGFDIKDVRNFSIEMNNPSTVSDLMKVELLSSKMSLANEMLNSGLFNDIWIYQNLFKFTDDEINNMITNNQKYYNRKFFYQKIEQSGLKKSNNPDSDNTDMYSNSDMEYSTDINTNNSMMDYNNSENLGTEENNNNTIVNKEQNTAAKDSGMKQNFNSSPFSLT